MRTAYSYLRYSSPQQSDGDSVRRQTALAKAWCDRNKARLDNSTTFKDLGKSAFRGKHRTGALGAFLDDVKSGRIAKGSALIVENLDRLSREDGFQALNLLTSIVNAGIAVVTLSPSEMVYEKGGNNVMGALVNAVIEFGRANSESEVKMKRSKQAVEAKRSMARGSDGKATGFIMTAAVPAWIAKREIEAFKDGEMTTKRELVLDSKGRMTLDARKAETVRRIFGMAAEGFSAAQIVRKLVAEKTPAIARKAWSQGYISKILRGREVLGELQPRTKLKEREDGKPIGRPLIDGKPIVGYYPPVIDEGLWSKAQAAIGSHKQIGRRNGGRIGNNVASLFAKLLTDAQSKTPMYVSWGTSTIGKAKKRTPYRVLLSAASVAGRGTRVSFPYDVFERAILLRLKEISPADILGEEPASESAALAAELAIKEHKLRELQSASIDDIPALVQVAKKLHGEAQDLARRLSIARQKDANPQSEAWEETQSLLELATDEDHRTRLRSLLRQIVEDIYILVVPRKTHRLAAVQIFFAGGVRRDYLIDYWGAGHGRKGGDRTMSWNGSKNIDLRKEGHADRLAKVLEKVPLASNPPTANAA